MKFTALGDTFIAVTQTDSLIFAGFYVLHFTMWMNAWQPCLIENESFVTLVTAVSVNNERKAVLELVQKQD